MKKNSKLYKIISLLILTAILSHQSQSQEFYQTSKAHLFLSVISNDHIIQKHYDKLKIKIDYQNAKISWFIKNIDAKAISELNHPIMDTETDDRLLSTVFGTPTLEFSGKLNLEYIKTESHPPQPFNIEGILKIGEHQKLAKGSGLITHIEAGEYVCMLEMVFQDLTFLAANNGKTKTFKVKFQIIQSLLKINNSNY